MSDTERAATANPLLAAPYGSGREITSHVVNPANDRIKLYAADGPGPGGANHVYNINMPDGMVYTVLFQNGPINADGNGVNGVTHEVLIAIIEDRLQAFQAGAYANDFNEVALAHLTKAREALQARTRERMARGVEGTHNV